MVAFKYRNRRDANEREIVRGLRRRGVDVYELDEPADLIVGYGRRLYLLEVKNPAGRGRLTPSQVAFHRKWKEHGVYVIETLDEALQVIGWRV